MKLFDFLKAKTTSSKMRLLEEFIVAWYGPRAESYGVDDEILAQLDLPGPLNRFYAFAGRWPARMSAEETGLEYFYTGAGYHHLLSMEVGNPVKLTHDGFIEFYMEYQGDWEILTRPGARSHRVWLRGCWNGCPEELEDEPEPTTQLPYSLVDFLITHILLTSFIEFPNNVLPSAQVFSSEFSEAVRPDSLIWEAPKTEFPLGYGRFYQLPNYIFAWECDGQLRFATSHPYGLQRILGMLDEA